jgi:hypothetical protein
MKKNWLFIFCLLSCWHSAVQGAIVVGRQVICTEDGVNVCSTAGGSVVGTQNWRAIGTVTDGSQSVPVDGINYTWWKVNFDSGTDGWVASDYLAEVSGNFIYYDMGTEIIIVDWITDPAGALILPPYIIGKPVSAIWDYSFYDCSGITSLTIPSTVTTIGNYAFAWCSALTTALIPSSVTVIGRNAFQSSGLTSVSIPSSVTDLGMSAFWGCSSLQTVSLPSSIDTIDSWTFGSCSSLSYVRIPSSVAVIGNNAFDGCASLETAEFLGNAPEMGGGVFDNTAADFTVKYHSGKSGFTSPNWMGYRASVLATVVPPTLLSPGIPDATGWPIDALTPVFSWLPVSGADGYGLYIRDMGTNTLIYDNDFVDGGSKELQLPVGILGSNRTYRWNMRARDSAGNWSDFSERFYFYTTASPFNAPGPLEGQFFSDRVELGWTDNTADETGFEIERATPGGAWALIGTAAAKSGSGGAVFFTDSNVEPRTSYLYRVRAVKSGAASSYSNEVSHSTPGGPPGSFVLSTQVNVGPSVRLTWTASQDAGGYTVYRNGNILPGGGGVTSPYTDAANLVPGTTYIYSVRASNADGTTYSNAVEVTIPQAAGIPGSFRLSVGVPDWGGEPGGPSATLNWDPSSGASEYSIFRDGSLAATVSSGVTTFSDANLIPQRQYQYFVRASNAQGRRDSNVVRVTMPTAPVAAQPVVQSIFPSTVAGSDARQWISIRGSGFSESSIVTLRTGDEAYTIPSSRTVFVDSGQIQVFVNVTTASAQWTAQVTNSGYPPSNVFAFQVNPPSVLPESGLDFGTVEPGSTTQRTFTVRNNGAAQALFSAGYVPAPFGVVSGGSALVEPGGEHSLVVSYNPATIGRDERVLTLTLGNSTFTRTVRGSAASAVVAGAVVEGTVLGRNANNELVPIVNTKVGLRKTVPGAGGLFSWDNYRWTNHDAFTDSDGHYRIEGAPPGDYLVSVQMEGANRRKYNWLGWTGTEVSLASGRAETVDFEFESLLKGDPANKYNQPVVLVRGKGKAGNNDEEIAYWSDMRTQLTAAGFNEVWDPNKDGSSTINGEMGIEDNSKPLWEFLKEKISRYELDYARKPDKVHFICHSMGGLILRQMLHDNAKGGATLELDGDVFMLSTPNAGSLLANNPLAYAVDTWFGSNWETTRDLKTRKVRDEFLVDWPSKSHRLFMVGGTTFEGDGGLEFCGKKLMNHSPEGDKINDGAVTVLSSRGDYFYRDEYGYSSTQSAISTPMFIDTWTPWKPGNSFDKADPHIPAFSLPLNHYDIISNEAVIDWISGILAGGVARQLESVTPSTPMAMRAGALSTFGSAGLVSMDEGGAASLGDAGTDFENEQTVDLIEGTLAAGSVETLTIPVDATALGRFFLVTPEGAAVSLVTPGGVGIDAGSVATLAGATCSESVADGRRVTTFDIPSPEAGVWQVVIDGATLTLAEADGYYARVSIDSQFALATIEQAFVTSGIEVVFKAGLGTAEDGLLAISGATVEAEIRLPDGAKLERQVFDDGTHGDGEAGDGLYGFVQGDLVQPGEHRIRYRADGVLPETGDTFRRVVEKTFTVADGGGFIAGEPSVETLDADGNGLPDAVLVRVPVAVATAGDYRLAGQLYDDEKGVKLAAVTDFYRDAAGTEMVTLNFDPNDLPEQEVFGPFEVRDLRLYRFDGVEPVWIDLDAPGTDVSTTLYRSASRSIRLTGDADFGSVPMGQSASRTVTIHNDGDQPFDVYGLSLPNGFSASFEGTVEPGDSESFEVTFAPAAENDYGGTLTADSNATGGDPTLSLSGTGDPEEVPLGTWLERKGVPEGLRGPADDPAGHGMENILYYLFDINPLDGPRGSDFAALPRAGLHVEGDQRFLSLRYRHNRNAVGLNIAVQVSETLDAASWQTVTPAAVIQTGTDPDTNNSLFEIRVPLTNEERLFIRLQVE